MRKNTYFCDKCGIERKEVNHWLLAEREDRQIRIIKWDEEVAACPHLIHLCGSVCVQKFVNEFLSVTQIAL